MKALFLTLLLLTTNYSLADEQNESHMTLRDLGIESVEDNELAAPLPVCARGSTCERFNDRGCIERRYYEVCGNFCASGSKCVRFKYSGDCSVRDQPVVCSSWICRNDEVCVKRDGLGNCKVWDVVPSCSNG